MDIAHGILVFALQPAEIAWVRFGITYAVDRKHPKVDLAEVGDLGAAAAKTERFFSGPKITNSVAKELGVSRQELGKAIESIKQGIGSRGAENVKIGLSTGDVFDLGNGEYIGNVFDYITLKYGR